MSLIRLTGLTIALTFTLPASLALADWQGKMIMTSPDLGTPMRGAISAKGTKLRMDMGSKEQRMTTITDMKSRKVIMLMHAQKMKMESTYDPSKQGVACSTNDIDACFRDQGFKKTGSDTANGHACDVYEGVQKTEDGKKVHQKIWRPKRLKEVVMVRAVSRLDGSKPVTIDITDIKVGKIPDSAFKVPAGYNAMPDMSKMLKGMKIPGGGVPGF